MSASETAPAAPPPRAGAPRVEALDVVRGLIIVVMALDHVRDYVSSVAFDPVDMTQTYPALFFTRWITHFCAPGFSFFAGAGAFLSLSRGKTPESLARFLASRGPLSDRPGVLRPEVRLVLQPLADRVLRDALVARRRDAGPRAPPEAPVGASPRSARSARSWSWDTTRSTSWTGSRCPACAGRRVEVPPRPVLHRDRHAACRASRSRGSSPSSRVPGHPVAGRHGAGLRVRRRARAAARRSGGESTFALGFAATVAFVVLRLANVYGDPRAWAPQKSAAMTLVAFLNCEKYPPSLCFLLMTLGPALMAFAWCDRPPGALSRRALGLRARPDVLLRRPPADRPSPRRRRRGRAGGRFRRSGRPLGRVPGPALHRAAAARLRVRRFRRSTPLDRGRRSRSTSRACATERFKARSRARLDELPLRGGSGRERDDGERRALAVRQEGVAPDLRDVVGPPLDARAELLRLRDGGVAIGHPEVDDPRGLVEALFLLERPSSRPRGAARSRAPCRPRARSPAS